MSLVRDYLPWLISLLTIMHAVLVGNKDIRGWMLALFNQCLWSIWVVVSATWGLLPLNIALWIIYTRNYRKWKREANGLIRDEAVQPEAVRRVRQEGYSGISEAPN